LCDHALDALRELSEELRFRVREVDIGEEPALWERYRYAVPVVCASGLTLLSGRIDAGVLRAEIERAFGPDPLAGVPKEEAQFLPALECPICEGDLESRPRAVACLRCGQEYGRLDGVLLLTPVPETSTRPNLMDRIGRLIGFKLHEPAKGR
jgi:hypothetical protein